LSNDKPVGVGNVIVLRKLQDLPVASLHQLAGIHTVLLPSKLGDNGHAIAGRVIQVAEMSLDAGRVTIVGQSGVKLVVDQSGLVEQTAKRDLVLKTWKRVKRQSINSTMLVYASTFVPFDSSF